MVEKYHNNTKVFSKPVHLNICLSKDTNFDDLTEKIRKSLNINADDKSFKFGIIGLHPCGDLASILINFFLNSRDAKFLNLVGCCYFKMTVSEATMHSIEDINQNKIADNNFGYPLSQYLKTGESRWPYLSFEAREIACHAIEVYAKRLHDNNYDYLRVHSFRAAIEKIICKYWPERKRSGLKSIKHLTTFRDYCQQAVSDINDIEIPENDIDASETNENLANWKLVVIFYTLRLMLAPIVETIILYDRILYLYENGRINYFEVLYTFLIQFIFLFLCCVCGYRL